MNNFKIFAAGVVLLALVGGGSFALGRTSQGSSTATSTSTSTTVKQTNLPEWGEGSIGSWGVYPVGDYFFGGSSKTIQIGLQCVSTKKAVIPNRGTESIPGGPASLWSQLTQENYGAPSDMHILHLAVVSPCDPNWAYVANWQNPTDTTLGFQGASGPAHFYNGKWITNYGTAGQWRGVPDPIRKSLGIGGDSG